MANDYQDKNGSGAGDWIYWVISLLALVKLPPVGILMLAARLFGGDKKRKKTKKGRNEQTASPFAGDAVRFVESETEKISSISVRCKFRK